MSRVALIGENSIEYINLLVDIWNNGDCAVLLDSRIPLFTAIEMMHEAGVRKCFIEKTLLQENNTVVAEDIEFVEFERNGNSAHCIPDEIYDKFRADYSHDEAVIIYSSGTTGVSKGVILSHFAINTNADAIIDYMRPNADDCIYIAKTLSHSSTLTGELTVALKSKMRAVVAPVVVPPRFVFNSIMQYNVSIVCVNPTLINMYADEAKHNEYFLSSLKTIYVSGSVLNDKIYNKTHDIFKNIKIYNVYGLSEAGPRLTAQREDCSKGNSVGKAIKGVEIAVVDEHGECVHCGERGIVHANTNSLYSGYVKGKEKNRSLYKGWLNTGDIGYFDQYGELHIVDRTDDVIIIDSHKIYPNDIENKILLNCKVNECVVLAVNYNEKDLLCCLYTAQTDLMRNIKTSLMKIVMPYEMPKIFIRVDSIPKSRNGKLVRRELSGFAENKYLELLKKYDI